MNIKQTRQALSYLWSSHPCAPKFDDIDKLSTIASFFRVLHRYSIEDVLDAIDQACRQNPTFVPSAYEIERCVKKTINIEAFLSDEFYTLDKIHPELKGLNLRIERINAACFFRSCVEEDAEKYQRQLNAIIERMDAEERMDELLCEAKRQAEDAYDEQQKQLAGPDLRSLWVNKNPQLESF